MAGAHATDHPARKVKSAPSQELEQQFAIVRRSMTAKTTLARGTPCFLHSEAFHRAGKDAGGEDYCALFQSD